MALVVRTAFPKRLLRGFRGGVDSGTVPDWSYDADGDFTLERLLWRRKAWVRPEVGFKRLTFNIICPAGAELSSRTYAVFHSRLAEALLSYFDELIDDVEITGMPTEDDQVGG